MIPSRIDAFLTRMQFARMYTLRILETIDPGDWFRVPPAGVTHVAWQVGHLAFAEFRLILERLCGHSPGDSIGFPAEFITWFGRDSIASADAASYPDVATIRAVFDGVHSATLREIRHCSESDLDLPPLSPHPICQTRAEVLDWASAHEMLHAGQIGLLRRQLGAKPIW